MGHLHVAMVGARQTGKTTLAHELAHALAARGHAASLSTTTGDDVVIVDIEVLSGGSAGVSIDHLTLLMALDLPASPDARASQALEDSLIRQALGLGALSYTVVSGQDADRLTSALAVVAHRLTALTEAAGASGTSRPRPQWRWICERCDDGECEQHWLPAGITEAATSPADDPPPR